MIMELERVLREKKESFTDANEQIDIKQLVVIVDRFIKRNSLQMLEIDEVLETCREFVSEDDFADFEDKLKNEITPYLELMFIRQLSIEDQKILLSNVFNRTVMENDADVGFAEEVGISKHQMSSCRKLFNTLLRLAISDNLSERLLRIYVREVFCFCDEIAVFLIKLLLDNKSELQSIYILKHISMLEMQTKLISDIFEQYFGEDIEDDE